ncbi:MAG: Wzz/FepE/Etk N-terminal domain-containing protein [Algisphaera sp.]
MNVQNMAPVMYQPGMPQPGVPLAPQPQPLSLIELAAKHKKLLLSCLGIALALGILAQLLIPPTYESRAQIYVQKSTSDASLSPLLGPGLSAGLPSTHADLLKTTPVLKAALASDTVRELASITRLGEKKLDHLRKKLRVSFAREGETVTATYRSRSAEDSAMVLKAVVDAYLNVQRADGAMVQNEELPGVPRGLLAEQMAATRLSELAQRQALAEVEAQQAAMLLTEAEAHSDDVVKLASLVDRSGADSQRLGTAELSYLTTELKKLDQQLESMPDGWGPEHAIRGPIQRQADAMRYEVKTLREQVAKAMFNLIRTNQTATEHRIRELASDVANQQTAAARVAKLPVSVIQWPEVPRKKVSPKAAQTLGIALFAGMGLGLMLMLRRELRDKPEDVMTTPAYAAMQPAAPMGYLPTEQQQQALAMMSPTAPLRLVASEDMDASTPEDTPLLGQMPEIPTAGGIHTTDFNDPAASIHQIRAVLQVQATATGARAYAFTSPNRGSGKTSVALGVASSLALSGTKTLVVDCDLAGRMAKSESGSASVPEDSDFVSDVVGSPFLEMGLADLELDRIEKELNKEENAGRDGDRGLITAADAGAALGITGMIDGAILSDCVIESSTPGLWLLPAIAPRASHISKLSDAFIRKIIDDARGVYDLVLFDTGPIPGSVEALLISSQVDGVVVVVKQGESRKALDRTMSYLKVVGSKITGTVFNRVGSDEGESANASQKGDGATLGSGILAAAVFSDAESDFASDDFELKETSSTEDGAADVFGSMNGTSHSHEDSSDRKDT